MANFQAPYVYQMKFDSSRLNGFIFDSLASDIPFLVHTQPNNLPFVLGEEAYATNYANYVSDSITIVAFSSDGIVGRLQGNEYWFFSTTGTYTKGEFLTVNSTPPVCFTKGTLLETMQGAVPIEALEVGDQVLGSSGVRTVKWVGWRHYHAVSLQTPEQRTNATPIRIMTGALGEQMPTQDLRVSPWHHLYIDGVLVRAKDLINGQTIVQELDCQQFSYYHVELDQFDVIRAHGVYAESWADGGNRDFFQNVDVTCLRPEDRQRRQANRPGFKVLRKPDDIAVIHARIAERAEKLMSVRVYQAA
jgi:hypothetical protein